MVPHVWYIMKAKTRMDEPTSKMKGTHESGSSNTTVSKPHVIVHRVKIFRQLFTICHFSSRNAGRRRVWSEKAPTMVTKIIWKLGVAVVSVEITGSAIFTKRSTTGAWKAWSGLECNMPMCKIVAFRLAACRHILSSRQSLKSYIVERGRYAASPPHAAYGIKRVRYRGVARSRTINSFKWSPS